MKFKPTEDQAKAVVARLGSMWKYSDLSKNFLYWKTRDNDSVDSYGWTRATEADITLAMLKAATVQRDPEAKVVMSMHKELMIANAENRDVNFMKAVMEAFILLPELA